MIAELITQLLRRAPESRILLVSQSNIALDNALERLLRLDAELPAIRLGRPERVSQETRHLMLSERSRLEAERLRARALEARTTMARLVGRSAEELEYLERELRQSAERTGDRESAQELAESVLGPSPHGTGTPLAERLAVARSLVAKGDAFLAGIMELQSNWAERVRADDEVEELLLQTVRVIGGTCIGVVASKVVSDAVFDWVIVDEAGRANPTELLVPLVKGRRLVLVGDHKQLPPVLDEDIAERVAEQHAIPQERLRRSLFEHLFEAVPEGARARLTRQYRMHPVIGGLIEHVFYPEGLDHAVDAAARPLGQRLLGSPLRWLDTGDGRTARESMVGTSIINAGEVSVIFHELEALAPRVTKRDTPISVGVLAGYQAQRDALDDAISSRRRDWPYLDVAVLTIDAAQGKEFDLVFYSAVRSNDQNRIGFLRDERRLNVALSRARHGLTIVGNRRALLAARGRYGVNWFSPILAWFSQDPAGRPILVRVP
jgi:serine/threonine-protein kinase